MMHRNDRRRRRQGNNDYGASWISYSDMMAALLLIFVMVLVYSVYQYYIMVDVKSNEILEKENMLAKQSSMLKDQEDAIARQKSLLDEQSSELKDKESEIASAQSKLDEQSAKLAEQENALNDQSVQLQSQQKLMNDKTAELNEKDKQLKSAQDKLSIAQNDLKAREADYEIAKNKLANQEAQLQSQQQRIDSLVGIKTSIIQDLSKALTQSNLRASVDSTTGDIVLESAIFFDTGKYKIKDSGAELLNKFLPVYFSVLLQDKYKDYLAEIIIEGHTDTVGEYMKNLELSQDRALAVAKFCFKQSKLSDNELKTLQSILTAKGRSFSNPILNPDGSINLEKSRRVEFKFRLKDSEMINEINEILKSY